MKHFENEITPRFLLRFTLPTVLMMVFNSFYTMADGGFVSNLVGTGALSAVNIVYPLLNLVFAVGIMLAAGGSAVIAKRLGEQRPKEAREGFTLILLVGAGAGAVLGGAGLLFTDPMMRLLGANDAVFGYCRDYAQALCLFFPAAVLQVLFQFFFSTAARPGLGLFSTVAGGIANLLFDYLFIARWGLGVRGAAIATGIGFLLPAALGLLYFSGQKDRLLHFARPSWDAPLLWEVCGNGSSEMVSNLSAAVTTFLFNVVMMGLLGEDGVAAVTIVLYAQFLFTAVFLGYSSGAAPLVSFHYGAQNRRNLKRIFSMSLLFVGLCSLAAFGASLLFSPWVVGVFAPAGSSVNALAQRGMDLFALGFLFMGMNIFASGLFTALGNGRVSALLSFLRTFLFLVASILLLPRLLGADGVWLAVPGAELLALLVSVWFLWRLRDPYGY